MTILATNWRDRVSPTDILVDGVQQPIPWLYGSRGPVSIDLNPLLDPEEEPVDVVRNLRRLPAVAVETEYSDYAAGLDGEADLFAGVVYQVLHDLERGRVYRLEVLFGPADHRRGSSLLIHCGE